MSFSFKLSNASIQKLTDEIYSTAQKFNICHLILPILLSFLKVCLDIDAIKNTFLKQHISLLGLISNDEEVFNNEDDIRRNFETIFILQPLLNLLKHKGKMVSLFLISIYHALAERFLNIRLLLIYIIL